MRLRFAFTCVAVGISLGRTSAVRANGLDDALGLEASIQAASQAFASPALPSLDNSGPILRPMIGSVSVAGVDGGDAASAPPGSFTPVYTGQVQGQMASLTYNSSGGSDLGFFATLAWDHVTGNMAVSLQTNTDSISNISATAVIASTGLSYRAIGSATSIFAFGLFAGPAFMLTMNSETVTQSDGTNSQTSMSPNIYGYYAGAQAIVRIGKFFINPYVDYFNDLSNHCRQDTVQAGTSVNQVTTYCLSGQQGVEVDGSIFADGINIGWGPVHINVYSTGQGAESYLKATSYTLSYSFGI